MRTTHGIIVLFKILSSKVAAPVLFAVFYISSNSALALTACPNVQVGINDNRSENRPALYSDCTMDLGDPATPYWLTLEVSNGVIRAGGYNPQTLFSPPPVGNEPFGTWDRNTLFAADMGSSYSGNCDEVTYSDNSINPVSGNVYCGVVGNTNGEKVYFRGTWTGTTWTSAQVLTDAAGVGVPLASEVTPVPVLPTWGFLLLTGLLGLAGFRKLR